MNFSKSNRNRPSGPQMPFKMLKELGVAEHGAHKRNGGHLGRKQRRKMERLMKKKNDISPKRLDGAKKTAVKRPKSSRLEVGKKENEKRRGPATKFDELVPDARTKMNTENCNNGELHLLQDDPELKLQQTLAKKLGLKGKTKVGGGDGLDDLLQELDDVMMGDFGESEDEDESDVSLLVDNENSERFYNIFPEEEPTHSTEKTSYCEEDEMCSDGEGESELDKMLPLDHSDNSLNLSTSNEEFQEENDTTNESNSMSKKSLLGNNGNKYVPPALKRMSTGETLDPDQEAMVVTRKVRGLINRIAETNMESIMNELVNMYLSEGRSYVSNALSEELINASCQGPRASEKFSIVAAVTVSSLAAMAKSPEPAATFLSNLGQALEDALQNQDSLACSNLVRLLGYLYLSKVVQPEILYDALEAWGSIFTEEHVVTIAGLLKISGLALRRADPQAMKSFVVGIHSKAAEKEKLSTRARVMLDLVVDIKNNRMKVKDHAFISQDANALFANSLHPKTAMWFKSHNTAEVSIGGISWEKIVKKNKKGTWWIPTVHDNMTTKDEGMYLSLSVDNDAGDESLSNTELLKLASGMKMTTDTRRAIFCAVMGGEDAIDATEKLLRLNLKGQQERDIVRIIVECCLYEKAWNFYYVLLLKRLCQLAKGHRITLQYCIWDHIKQIPGMSVRQLSIFSKLCAQIVHLNVLSLPSIVKTVSFSAHNMTSKELLVWRTFFRSIFEEVNNADGVRKIFERLIDQKTLSDSRREVKYFLKKKFGPWIAEKRTSNEDEKKSLSLLLTLCNAAEKLLH